MTGEDEPPQPLVSMAEALFIHTVMVNEMGGATGLGVRDHGAIESALHRPLGSFGGELQHKTPQSRVATLWWGLIKNHGFVDANKRTASVIANRWLDREGYWLRMTQAELVQTAVDIAQNRMGVEELTDWIGERMQPHAGAKRSSARGRQRSPARTRSRGRERGD